MMMTAGLRKLALTAHVTFSVGWLGAVAAFVALAVAGLICQDTLLVRAAYLAMNLLTWFVIVPLALASLLTGVVSSLGTAWGLFRYYWVLVKLVIATFSAIILLVHTEPIELLAGVAAKTTVSGINLQGPQMLMVVASGAALAALLVLTVLSVYKPRGMTRYGVRRQMDQQRAPSEP